MKNRIKILSISLILVMLFTALCGCAGFDDDRRDQTAELPSSITQSQNVKFEEEEITSALSLVDAVAKVERSVIAVEMQEEGQAVSLGSGVIVDVASGKEADDEDVYYILTCHHVISSMGDIVIYIPDDNCRNYGDSDYDDNYSFSGKIGKNIYNNDLTLVGGDKESDVAVLRLDVEGRKNKNGEPINIVASKVVTDKDYTVRRGESVFAIGNPSGELPGSITSGVIGYINREIYLSEVGYITCYQLNTDIYHGSSGGGLFNMYGQLIGITNAGSDAYSGINYAIPYTISEGEDDNGFVNIATQLIGTASGQNYGYISGRWNIGLTVNTQGTDGIEVISVDSGSNAEKAGLLAKDVVKAIEYTADGNKIEKVVKVIDDFSGAVNDMKRHLSIGDSFRITVDRPSGFRYEEKTLTVTLSSQYIFCDTGY